jgi:hypothetical protein
VSARETCRRHLLPVRKPFALHSFIIGPDDHLTNLRSVR